MNFPGYDPYHSFHSEYFDKTAGLYVQFVAIQSLLYMGTKTIGRLANLRPAFNVN